MSKEPDLAERIAAKIASEAIDYDNEDADGNRHPYVMEHRAAAIIRDTLAASPELAQVREALEELALYPVARAYPDGPCLRKSDMEDVKIALATLNALTGKAP